jgi:hypothetical protein
MFDMGTGHLILQYMRHMRPCVCAAVWSVSGVPGYRTAADLLDACGNGGAAAAEAVPYSGPSTPCTAIPPHWLQLPRALDSQLPWLFEIRILLFASKTTKAVFAKEPVLFCTETMLSKTVCAALALAAAASPARGTVERYLT